MFRIENTIRNLAAIAAPFIGVALSSSPALGQVQTYDLAADWSITANPNGAWTYGRMDGALSFTPFTSTFDAASLGDFFGHSHRGTAATP